MVLKHIPGAQEPLPQAFPWYVLCELADRQEAALQADLEDFLARQLAAGSIRDGVVAATLAQAKALWALRENISEAQKIEGISIKHDVSVPVSKIPAFLHQAGEALAVQFPGIRVVAFGHLGDGNLHYNLSKADHLDNAQFLAQQGSVNQVVHDLVASLGGSISAEHGLGQLKREEIRRYKSPVELNAMAAIKRALDPLGLMNPGKVL